MGIFETNGWLVAIIVGIAAGWIAEQVTGRRHGILTNLIVGLLGAILGWWLSENVLGIPITGWLGSLVAATGGAVVLLFIFGLIRRREDRINPIGERRGPRSAAFFIWEIGLGTAYTKSHCHRGRPGLSGLLCLAGGDFSRIHSRGLVGPGPLFRRGRPRLGCAHSAAHQMGGKRLSYLNRVKGMVGATGFEPATP